MNIITKIKEGLIVKLIAKVFLICAYTLNISAQTQLIDIFKDGVVSGQIDSTYIQQNFQNATDTNNYATALGGKLKYETASFEGFNAAVAFYTSQDINFATGDRSKVKQNSELSSDKGSYTQAAEAYINYGYEGFNLRAGRQVIDTPLADSDSIRIIQNTFEAYIATYTNDALTFQAGKLVSWQGYDAGLENGFTPVGKQGAWLGSASFSNNLFDASAWFYNVTDFSNLFYTDAGTHIHVNNDVLLHVRAQYINEQELKQSTINAQLYGVKSTVEFEGFAISAAYNKALVGKDKTSFSGFGGGALYTNMDTMILKEIATDRDAEAFVGGISYTYDNIKLIYAYGDFHGSANSLGEKADIIEQNIGFEYNVNNDLKLSAIYAKDIDKIDPNNTQTNWDRVQINIAYNFGGKSK